MVTGQKFFQSGFNRKMNDSPALTGAPSRAIRLAGFLGLILCLALPVVAAPAATTKPKPTKPDPASATIIALVREIVDKRLLECVVTKYPSEPAKKLVRIKAVAVPNKYFLELSYQLYEKESGQIFKKVFTSKVPVKRVEIQLYLPPAHKELAYYIVLTEKEAKTVNWSQIDSIDVGSVAVYLWPLPDRSCVGFGDF
jgi:hypothetical protein